LVAVWHHCIDLVLGKWRRFKNSQDISVTTLLDLLDFYPPCLEIRDFQVSKYLLLAMGRSILDVDRMKSLLVLQVTLGRHDVDYAGQNMLPPSPPQSTFGLIRDAEFNFFVYLFDPPN